MSKSRYKSLADALAADIASGRLRPGSKLLPHRKLAEHKRVSLGTATRTYRELAARGLIIGEKGRGVFVRDQSVPLTLGVEQRTGDGLLDLVFNMPGSASDVDFLRSGLKRIAIAGDLEAMLQYQPHAGRPHERKIIARHLETQLGQINPDNLLIVSGAQHGLSLIVIGLLKRGDTVAADHLTYAGFKSVASLHGINLVPVAHRNGSMDPEDLDRLCSQRHVRAVYTIPTVHNPLGSVMNMETRKCFTDVARRHDLLVIEDGAYAFLETFPPKSFIELMPERTIYVGSFSKSVATGLRMGYVVTPDTYLDTLIHVIRATTWNAPALISALVVGWIEDGTLKEFEDSRRQDGARRQALCRKHLWNTEVVAHKHSGFAWLPLQNGIRSAPIIKRLMKRGYAVSGGEAFAIGSSVPQAIRIAFGGVNEESFREGLICIRKEIKDATR